MKPQENSPHIISLDLIQEVLPKIDLFDTISKGFIAYSKGEAVIPPVGEMLFDDPPGEVHIKYGYIHSQPYYIIKIASGFYKNRELGISSSHGQNLLFDKNTGILCAVLLDEGQLTDIRTAVAGAIATKALASESVKQVGIVGAGIQGRMQLEYLEKLIDIAEKNELDPHLLERADIVIVDSLSQCKSRGEVFRATKAGYLKTKKVYELGNLLNGDIPGRNNPGQISIADLTGLAVQDLMISQSVYEKVYFLKK